MGASEIWDMRVVSRGMGFPFLSFFGFHLFITHKYIIKSNQWWNINSSQYPDDARSTFNFIVLRLVESH